MILTIHNHRAGYIIKELGNKCQVKSKDQMFTDIEILELNTEVALALFHAGVLAGFESGMHKIEDILNKKLGVFNY
jgi:hypothetical protein